jgi:hypothetical protein
MNRIAINKLLACAANVLVIGVIVFGMSQALAPMAEASTLTGQRIETSL